MYFHQLLGCYSSLPYVKFRSAPIPHFLALNLPPILVYTEISKDRLHIYLKLNLDKIFQFPSTRCLFSFSVRMPKAALYNIYSHSKEAIVYRRKLTHRSQALIHTHVILRCTLYRPPCV